jgi:hypothetical protein
LDWLKSAQALLGATWNHMIAILIACGAFATVHLYLHWPALDSGVVAFAVSLALALGLDIGRVKYADPKRKRAELEAARQKRLATAKRRSEIILRTVSDLPADTEQYLRGIMRAGNRFFTAPYESDPDTTILKASGFAREIGGYGRQHVIPPDVWAVLVKHYAATFAADAEAEVAAKAKRAARKAKGSAEPA